MATTMSTTRTYPKRKRAEVSYVYEYQGSSDESDVDEAVSEEAEDVSEDEAPARKKLKASTNASPAKALPKTKVFPFKQLPPELRNKIYHAALANGGESIVLASQLRRHRRTVRFAVENDLDGWNRCRLRMYGMPVLTLPAIPRPFLAPNILALDRQINAEANAMLYAGNSFELVDTSALHTFCANIGFKNCTLLRNLTIKEWGHSTAHKAMNHPALTMLANCTSLERLHLECPIKSWGTMNRVAQQFFRDGHHFLEQLGSTKGRRDGAVEIVSLGDKNMKNYANRYRRLQNGEDGEEDELVEEFQAELRRLLGVREDRAMA